MVLVVLGVAVFVLALAVVGLFAMMGELASRVSDPDQLGTDSTLLPVEEARLGTTPADWPAELAPVRDADRAYLLVFSSICSTCAQIASGSTGPLDQLQPPVGAVISCPTPEAGAEFLDKHPMVGDYPHLIDVGGAWLADTLGVRMTPSVLVFERGTLRSAHTFTSAAALSNLPEPGHEHEPGHGPESGHGEEAHVHVAKAKAAKGVG